MSGRVWGLAGLCVALAGLLWLGPGPERAAPGAVSDPLPPLGEWQSFSVHRQGWAPIEVQREAGGWRVGAAALDADATQLLEDALSGGVGFDQRSAAPDDATRARFGFGPHSVEVRLRTAAGERRLVLGKVLDGQRTFVTDSAAGEDAVLRAKANLRRVFERPPHTWPERRLFPTWTLGQIARLSRIEGAHPRWTLARDAADRPWRLAHPPEAAVGQSEAVGIVNSLVNLEAERFEDGEGAFQPVFTLEAQTFGGQRFGVAVARGPHGLRARRLDGGPVAALPRWITRSLDLSEADLLDRRLLTVPFEDLQAVVAEGARPLHLVRRADGAWIAEAQPEVVLDPNRVQAYLRNLIGLRIGGFAAQRPADAFNPVHQRIRLALTEGRVAEIRVGAVFGQGRYVESSERRDGHFVLGEGALGGIMPTLQDLQPPAEAPTAPAP